MRGLGNDIIAISRIERVIHRHGVRFLEKIFLPEEIAYCQTYRDPVPHFAGRFAAKEAIAKALGTGLGERVGWLDMQICRDSLGRPYVEFSDTLHAFFGSFQCMISISHCREYAMATALIWDTHTI